MRTKVVFALIVAAGILAAILAVSWPPTQTGDPDLLAAESNSAALATDAPPPPAEPEAFPALPSMAPPVRDAATPRPLAEVPATTTTNRLERLAQIRETFRALAAGEPVAALRAAKQLKDETERETALFTLVTEWTHGEIRPPRERARAIATYGLEAGLGFELAQSPELAVQWANELTDGAGRTAVLQQAALTLLDSNPSGAFALSGQLLPEQRQAFCDALLGGWAEKDTTAAIDWASQLPDPAQREGALQSIRSVAPVGIGAAISVQEGMPVINQLLPGTPAELSGQVHPGDRILALAQGNNAFVDARNLPLQEVVEMIRGTPGTVLQLQVLAADAPPGSPPRTVSILRDQIKFKR